MRKWCTKSDKNLNPGNHWKILIKTEPYKTAGQRIEARRLREVGLNWNDVATKLGISLSTVKRLSKLDVVDPVKFSLHKGNSDIDLI